MLHKTSRLSQLIDILIMCILRCMQKKCSLPIINNYYNYVCANKLKITIVMFIFFFTKLIILILNIL